MIISIVLALYVLFVISRMLRKRRNVLIETKLRLYEAINLKFGMIPKLAYSISETDPDLGPVTDALTLGMLEQCKNLQLEDQLIIKQAIFDQLLIIIKHNETMTLEIEAELKMHNSNISVAYNDFQIQELNMLDVSQFLLRIGIQIEPISIPENIMVSVTNSEIKQAA